MTGKPSPSPAGNLLRITVFSGLMLLLLIGALLAGIYLKGGGSGMEESRFHSLLTEYDYRFRRIQESAAVLRQELDNLDNELDRLEKRTEGVETWLSVLKRRRQLAAVDSYYTDSYRQSSQRAALAFPHSEPIAAVAAAALIHDAAITREGDSRIRSILPLFADSRYIPLRLYLHVLLGDFRNPGNALANLPPVADIPYAFSGPEASREILANLALLHILAGNNAAAAVMLQDAFINTPAPAITRLAAEFYYDFGDLLIAAELFSMLPDAASLIRQADSLWLAGYADNARTVWGMLAAPATPGGDLYCKALYNLALTARTQREAAALLERLIGQAGMYAADSTGGDRSREFGLIRYSRFFEAARAIDLLDAERAQVVPGNPDTLVDLEIIRRRSEIAEPGRVIAETWLLLERYPQAEDLYQWGAWFFNLHRNYTESALLLRTAARHNHSGRWLGLYNALQLIREDNLDAAREALAPVAGENWAAAANLGRILEAYHAPAQALAYYEQASAAVRAQGFPAAASRIQVRIAHCHKTQGRLNESRQALEYALELNPDNLNARMELTRL